MGVCKDCKIYHLFRNGTAIWEYANISQNFLFENVLFLSYDYYVKKIKINVTCLDFIIYSSSKEIVMQKYCRYGVKHQSIRTPAVRALAPQAEG